MSEPIGPTRGEFTMLMAQVATNTAETRGIGVLQQQITDLAKDVAKVEEKLEQHEKNHEADKRERESARRSTRRWAVGLAFSGLAAVGGLYGWVALLLHR